ncbi:MAG: hypothetical protein M1835_003972 [Candelina submexicana]|nr:MAG: hypothetical protein M1835_003972 [Candelina submexicana]
MRPSWLVIALCPIASAQPTLRPRGAYNWSPTLRNYYEAVGSHIARIRDTPDFPNPPACDLTQATLPSAPSPLPPPATGLRLAHVAIGRGTQNYTCSNLTARAVPVPMGATAKLYNASCIAATMPDILAKLPNVTMEYAIPNTNDPLWPANIDFSGFHFFPDATTPTFDLDTAKHDYGLILSGKNASTPAPSDAIKGQSGVGFGAVPWLKLNAKIGTASTFSEVYRVNTAGGAAPPTCESAAGTSFEIQYAAE